MKKIDEELLDEIKMNLTQALNFDGLSVFFEIIKLMNSNILNIITDNFVYPDYLNKEQRDAFNLGFLDCCNKVIDKINELEAAKYEDEAEDEDEDEEEFYYYED